MIFFPSIFFRRRRTGEMKIVLKRKKGKQRFHDDDDDDEKKGKRVEFVFTKKHTEKMEKSMPSYAAAVFFCCSVCHILFTS